MADTTAETAWEHFPHQADIGVRGRGRTKAAAFEQAAIALTAVITNPQIVEPKEKVKVACRAEDDETLFVDWLAALIYEMDIRKMLFSRFEVRIERHKLDAVIWGEKIDVSRHSPAVEVKGATYTALKVEQDEQGNWIAQCVVDV